MIIIKHGRYDTDKEVVCKCGCTFIYTTGDLMVLKDVMKRRLYVQCPECLRLVKIRGEEQ